MLKVSIIVPVFNEEKYIRRCLDSLINQTLQEIEIICVDDCSMDQSLNILHEYEKNDKRVKVYGSKENNGTAVSRNIGLRYAQGEYIQFVDADDYIELYALERLYKRTKANKSDMCFMGMQIHQGDRSNKAPRGIENTYDSIYNGKELLGLFIKNEEFFLYSCSVFYNRDFLDRHEMTYKKITIGEGGNFILRALFQASTVLVEKEKYYHYCLNNQSVTHSKRERIESLLGQIYQYIDMFRLMSVEHDSDVLDEYLEKQYCKIRGGINILSKEDADYIESKLEDKFSKSIFRMFTAKYSYISEFSNQELKLIKEASKIVIYGAGYASCDVIELLNKYQIEIFGFAVSSGEKAPCSLYGHHVFDIEQLKAYCKELLVVVAANKKHHVQIKENLDRYGFEKALYLNIKI